MLSVCLSVSSIAAISSMSRVIHAFECESADSNKYVEMLQMYIHFPVYFEVFFGNNSQL